MQLILKDHVTLHRVDQGVYVRAGLRGFLIKGRDAYAAAAKLTGLMDGRHTLASLQAGMPENARPFLNGLVEQLMQANMLHHAEATPENSAAADAQRALRMHNEASAWFRSATQALPGSAAASPLQGRVGFCSSSAALMKELAAPLVAQGSEIFFCSAEEFTAAPGDLVVAIFGASDRIAAHRVAAQACASGAVLLSIETDTGSVRLGPITRTDRRGCVGCVDAWSKAVVEAGHASPWPKPFLEALAGLLHQMVLALRGGTAGSALENAVLRFDTETCDWSRHSFVPHPDCGLCSAPARDAIALADEMAQLARPHPVSGDYREAGPGAGLPALEARLVDPYCGLVRKLEEAPNTLLHPMTLAVFPSDDDPSLAEVGVGRTPSREADRTVAILEALERFAGSRPRGGKPVVTGSFLALGDDAVDPRAFVLCDPAQYGEPGFRLAPYREDQAYRWVWGYSFRRRSAVLVPEQLAYRSPAALEDGDRFVLETSNGCALGRSLPEAILYGLFEVIERDAYLTTWYGRLPATPLDLRGLRDDHLDTLVARAGASGLKIHACDVGAGLSLPTIAVLLVDASDAAPTASVCAAGGHFDPRRALRGALVEACTHIVRRDDRAVAARHRLARDMLADSGRVRTMDDHGILYNLPQSAGRLTFLFQGPLRGIESHYPDRPGLSAPHDRNAALVRLIGEVLDTAQDVIVIDQGFDTMSELGFRCVKVLAPGLLPMTFGHQYRRISADRIRKALRLRGAADAYNKDAAWLPHNFL